MKSRPLGRKPALALWLLVAVADLVLVASAIGAVAALSVLAGLIIVGMVGRQAWVTRASRSRVTARRGA
jgi:hypothetical protein